MTDQGTELDALLKDLDEGIVADSSVPGGTNLTKAAAALRQVRQDRDEVRQLLADAALALPEISGPISRRIMMLKAHWNEERQVLRAANAALREAVIKLHGSPHFAGVPDQECEFCRLGALASSAPETP